MSATQVQTEAPEKFLVRNNTAGYVGVVKVDHKGEELGENIEPYGATWMTEHEMLLTSRAPRRPEDNPFEEQTLIGVNPETQAREEFKVRPLTLETDAQRFVPNNDRYVPTVDAPKEAGPASQHDAAGAPSPAAAPASSGSQAGVPPSAPSPPESPQGAPVPTLRTAPTPAPPTRPPEALDGSQVPAGGEEQSESWVQPPERPGEVISGSLAGSDDAPPAETAAAASDPTDALPEAERFTPVAGQAQAAVQTPGAVEEHAAKVDPEIGEETGAARPPTQPQPEGEFAQAEEVGSPEAPEQDNDVTLIGG